MTSLTVIGRRWFQRGPGNTYHTASIIIDGRTVHKTPFAYGYGSAYEQSAAEWLAREGLLTCERHANGSSEPLWQACKRLGIAFSSQAVDVARKRDL